MSLAIREATGDADLAAYAAIVNAGSPEDPTSVAELRWSDATYPGGLRLLAHLDGRTVGAASVGRIYVHPPEFPYLWGTLDVLADARRQGVGTALLTRISAHAATEGKVGLHIPASASRPFAVEFLLHRRFEEHERMTALRLDLDGLAPPEVDAPSGLTLTTLAEHPELVTGVHRVALEAFNDIPGGDEPMTVGDLAEFRARDVDRRLDPGRGVLRRGRGGDRGRRRLLEPDADARLDDDRVVRHDRGAAGMARPRRGRGPQAGNHRLGHRSRSDSPRHRQRHRQRPDARREREARLPAPARSAHPARSAVRRHDGAMTDASPSSGPLPPDPIAYDSPSATSTPGCEACPAPYIVGGTDPDPEVGLARGAQVRALLIWMVATIIVAGFMIGIAIALALGALTAWRPARPARSRPRPGPPPTTALVETLRDAHPHPLGQPAVHPAAPDGELSPRGTSRQAPRGRASRPRSSSPCPGRGSVHVRLRGDGTGGEPLLLLSHLDVVPAPPERWTHEPFAADLADGYV